jgi:hypothetical protein
LQLPQLKKTKQFTKEADMKPGIVSGSLNFPAISGIRLFKLVFMSLFAQNKNL